MYSCEYVNIRLLQNGQKFLQFHAMGNPGSAPGRHYSATHEDWKEIRPGGRGLEMLLGPPMGMVKIYIVKF